MTDRSTLSVTNRVHVKTEYRGCVPQDVTLRGGSDTNLARLHPVFAFGCFMAFAPLIDGGTTHLPVLIMRLSLISAVTVWLLWSMRSGIVSLYRSRLFSVIALFLGWAAVTLVWSPYKNVGVQWIVTLLCYGIFVLLVVQHVSTVRHVRGLVAVIVAMGVFQAIVGTFQVLSHMEWRARGTFFNPNFFASYEAVCLILSFAVLTYTEKNQLSLWEKIALKSSVVSAVLALIWAQSRGALLACVVVVTCVGCFRYKRAFVLVLISCTLALVLFPNPLRDRIAQGSSYDPFAYTRLEIWKDALHRIYDHPFGMGMGMYQYGSFEYRFPVEEEIVRYGKRSESAHSEYLQVAVELGVVGLALLLAGVVVWCQEAIRAVRCTAGTSDRGLTIGLIGSSAMLLIHAIVDSAFHQPALVFLLLLCGALVFVMRRIHDGGAPAGWSLLLPNRLGVRLLVCGWMLLMTVLIIQPAAGWTAFDRGELAASTGDGERAFKWFEIAALIDPGTAAYHDAIGLACLRSFHATRNVEWIARAFDREMLSRKLNPLDPRFANRLGATHLLLAEGLQAGPNRDATITKAAEFFEEARRLDPFSPFSYLELARIRYQQGRLYEAQALLDEAIRYEPNFLPGRVLLAELLLANKEELAARREYHVIKSVSATYAGRVLSSIEHSFLDVDLRRVERIFEKSAVQ